MLKTNLITHFNKKILILTLVYFDNSQGIRLILRI